MAADIIEAALGIAVTDVRTVTPTAAWAGDDTIQALIMAAVRRLNRQLQLRGGDLAALTDNPDLYELARDIVITAVSRTVRNQGAAEGYATESEGSYSYGIANPLDVSASVWFADSDLDMLWPRPATDTLWLKHPARARHPWQRLTAC